MSYTKTAETADYEVGVKDGTIIAACRCGAGEVWPNKGMGRAFAATWKTRHQHGNAPTTNQPGERPDDERSAG